MTLYLKYRPQTIEELDIKEVRENLGEIVKSGHIPHAFLFSGPKGTGKTSAARILAKIVNCEKPGKSGEPCNKCDQCISTIKGSNLDVMELDAASHRGIDDVRALREAVKLAPSKSKKKVYIIDEAHMLTLEASNALLKTLEEPPDHVLFILATTNPEKLIETIRSRVMQLDFRKATSEELVNSLLKVVKGEKLKISSESLDLVALKAGGSFRDATKILEQLISEKKKLDEKSVEEFLFSHKGSQVEEFIKILADKNTQKGLEFVEDLVQKGISLESFLTDFLGILRKNLLAKVGIGKDEYELISQAEIVGMIKLFSQAQIQLKVATIEQLPVEVSVVEWCEDSNVIKEGSGGEEDADEGQDKKDNQEIGTTLTAKVVNNVTSEKINEVSLSNGNSIEITDEAWKTILLKIRPINASIEALLRAAKPMGLNGSVVTLGVFYKFHKERLEENRNRRVFEDVAATVLGRQVRVVCLLTEPPPKKVQVEAQENAVLTEGTDQDIIDVAKEIFSN